MLTREEKSPPIKPPAVATGFEDDDIRDLGDRIAKLTLREAKELQQYLRGCGGTR